MFKRFGAIALICITLLSSFALGVPLQTYQDFTTANPITSRRGQWVQMLMRGEGTTDQYVLEVDPTTGAIPVSATFSDPTAGTPGQPVPAEAGYIAGIDTNGDLRGVSVDLNGFVNVNADLSLTNDTNYGTVGANTLRTAAQIGNATGAAAFAAGNSSAQTLRVVVATDQASIPTKTQDGAGNSIGSKSIIGTAPSVDVATANYLKTMSLGYAFDAVGSQLAPLQISSAGDLFVAALINTPSGGDIDFGAGAATSATIRVVPASNAPSPSGRTYADSANLDYSSSNVGLVSWVQVIASTAATINNLLIFSSCGSALELGTGAAASETRKLLIPPGGLDAPTPLVIASGTRISVRAITGTGCTSGNLIITGLN